MSSHDTTVHAIYEAFNRRDYAAVLERFHPEAVWEAAERSPLGAQSPYRGVEAIREQVFGPIAAGLDMTIRVEELLAAGDQVVALGRYAGTVKATGRGFDVQLAHVWTLREGRVARFRQYVDTLGMAQALTPAPAPLGR